MSYTSTISLKDTQIKHSAYADICPPATIKTKQQFLERLHRSHEQTLRGEVEDMDAVLAEMRQTYGF